MNKHVLSLILLVLSIVLTGCWGQQDIENRGFVIGTAIDLEEKQAKDEDKIKMTNQTVVPPLIGSPGLEGSPEVATTNISLTGNSMLTITDNIDTKSERIPFYEHLKLIVVSEDFVSTPHYLPKLIDYFIREGEMRREIRLVIAEGEASPILDIEPKGEQLPILYIDSLFEYTEEHTLQVLPIPRIGDIHELLLTNYSYAIPKVKKVGNEVEVNEVVAFDGKTDTVAGTLNKEEVEGLNLILGQQNRGILDFKIDQQLMNLQIMDLNSTVHMNVDDLDDIKIKIDIDLSGVIDEMFNARSLMDEGYLHDIEKAIEKRTEELVMKAIDKGQNELELDIFEFNKQLYGWHYDEWEKLKDNWDEGENYFVNNTTIEVSAQAKVEAIGATDKVKR